MASPALRALGAQCSTGLDISAVALVTEVVLTWLRGLLAGATGEAGDPTIVVTGGPGERHELGSLMLLWRLRGQGWRTVYLGPDPPRVALEAAWTRLRADLFCVTATTRASAADCAEVLEALARHAPASSGGRLSYAGPGFAGMDTLHARLRAHALFLGSDLDHAARTALGLHATPATPLSHRPSRDE